MENMTYGEYINKIREDMSVVGGECEFPDLKAPKRMPKDEALEYYNKKLKKAWIEEGYYDFEIDTKYLSRLPKRLSNAILALIEKTYECGRRRAA